MSTENNGERPLVDDALDWPKTVYREQCIARYRGNPFIEALPPILDPNAAIDAMQHLVTASPAQRALPSYLRKHEVAAIEDFCQPLDVHVELHDRISVMIRAGYVNRNPLSRRFLQDVEAGLAELKHSADAAINLTSRRNKHGAGSSLTLLGMSGVGKSHAVDAVLRTYEQVIAHTALTGQLRSVLQVVFLKVTCPPDGSIRGLCIDFFKTFDGFVGTNYSRQYVGRSATVDSLRVAMARISFLHGLGLLVIDEVQHLSEAKSGGAERMVNFFKLLSDVMQVPVLVVGTPDAAKVLGGNFQAARRHSGMPMFEPMPMSAPSNPTMEGKRPEIHETFRFFCESLFRAQFLARSIEPDYDLLVSRPRSF